MMDHSRACVTSAATRWQAVVARGLLGVVFGVAVVQLIPLMTLQLLAVSWAAYVVSDGALAVLVARARGRRTERWGWLLFEGAVGMTAGLATIAWTGATALGLLVTIAVRTLLSGVAELREATLLRRTLPDELTTGAGGVLSMLAGVAMLAAYSDASVRTVVWLIGAHAFAFGALELVFGARLGLLRPALRRSA